MKKEDKNPNLNVKYKLSEILMMSYEIVREKSNKLIETHERFRKLVEGSKYQLIELVLLPDKIGIDICTTVIEFK